MSEATQTYTLETLPPRPFKAILWPIDACEHIPNCRAAWERRGQVVTVQYVEDDGDWAPECIIVAEDGWAGRAYPDSLRVIEN